MKRSIAGERGLEIDMVVLSRWPNKEIKCFRNHSMGLKEEYSRGKSCLDYRLSLDLGESIEMARAKNVSPGFSRAPNI